MTDGQEEVVHRLCLVAERWVVLYTHMGWCDSMTSPTFLVDTLISDEVRVLGNSRARALTMSGAGGVVPVIKIVYQYLCTEHDYHISLA